MFISFSNLSFGQYTETFATADRGIIRNKEQIAELESRVRAETDTATIDSDRGIYNMNTDIFRAIGNVFIDYNMN